MASRGRWARRAARAAYAAAGYALYPFVWGLMRARLARGKEDPLRYREKFGHAGLARPQGRVVWMHGASIGETRAGLMLARRIVATGQASVVMTSGTVTSARILARELPEGALHQFAPLDLAPCARRFLDHWQPDAVLWIESDLWPGLVGAAHARGLPLALVNARMSERSARRWGRARPFAAALLGAFDPILAQSAGDAERLQRLGARHARYVGNLKMAAAPLPVDPAQWAAWEATVSARPLWLGASTHPGEEEILLRAHQAVLQRWPDALMIIAPRHPERATDARALARGIGLKVASASLPALDDQVFVADTVGEMGLWYRLAPLVFMGGSLVPHGGQNPFEAAQLGAMIVTGPHVENFAAMVAAMEEDKAIYKIAPTENFADALVTFMGDENARRERAARAAFFAQTQSRAMDEVWNALAEWRARAGI